jgi:hypothetical protein
VNRDRAFVRSNLVHFCLDTVHPKDGKGSRFFVVKPKAYWLCTERASGTISECRQGVDLLHVIGDLCTCTPILADDDTCHLVPFTLHVVFLSLHLLRLCISVLPQTTHAAKDNPRRLRKLTLLWVILLYTYVGIFSAGLSLLDDAVTLNWYALSAYLFPPGWLPCLGLSICTQLLFQLYRPRERETAWIWGVVTDCLSVALLAGWLFYGLAPEAAMPAFSEEDYIATRYWAALFSRMVCPVGFLWFFGIAVGKSVTSWIFSGQLILNWLAPASYNMFLFHQPVRSTTG